MTPDDPRAELAQIAASLRAYLEWQQESGASGIPRGARVPAPAASEAAARAPAYAEPPKEPAARAPASYETQQPRVAASEPRPVASESRGAAPVVLPVVHETPQAATHGNGPQGLARLEQMRHEVAGCTKCGLAATRTNTVFSRGNPQSKLCFVGEAPGADEDAQGLPFVGRAGQLLDKMIAAMGLSPDNDVYVCNIIKCRPPGNRRPTPEESSTCIPYLHEQLAIVRPRVIVALGNTAVASLLQTTMGITKIRGQWKLYRGATLVMPTYHPSYLLRPSATLQQAKREAWDDLQLVMKELGLELPKKK
ncbi:uracil-DNA glycosylase [Pendulispora albinea]|uniref:Type-4 uracil-DNA glycosylase n=1 Tax=Pendulispora albinea TaxID=2741071 RepID=A0ABZ2M276_9BACT